MYFLIKLEHSSLCGEGCSLFNFFAIFHYIYLILFKCIVQFKNNGGIFTL